MKNKITLWFMEWVGVLDAYQRIVDLEEKTKKIETDITGLKMEADIMYSKTLENQ